MCDPTCELSFKEQHDRFSELLSMGHTRAEACAILDTEYMTKDEWLEMYVDEEVDYSHYSIQVSANQPLEEMLGV